MAKKVNLKSLRAGQTVYCVNAIGRASYVQKHVITSRPFPRRSLFGNFIIGMKVNTVTTNEYRDNGTTFFERGFFLSDYNVSGVIGNKAARHKVFYSLKAAERYKEQCIKYNVVVAFDHDDYWFEEE